LQAAQSYLNAFAKPESGEPDAMAAIAAHVGSRPISSHAFTLKGY
jgi:hypothetical protein